MALTGFALVDARLLIVLPSATNGDPLGIFPTALDRGMAATRVLSLAACCRPVCILFPDAVATTSMRKAPGREAGRSPGSVDGLEDLERFGMFRSIGVKAGKTFREFDRIVTERQVGKGK